MRFADKIISRMPPLRVAHVVEATEGGVARHVLDLVTGLDPAVCACVVYASLGRSPLWAERFLALRERGITVREIPMARLPNPTAVNQIGAWAVRDGAEILHLHSAKAGYLGRLAARDLDTPVIYTPHAFPFQRATDWLRPVYRLVERRLAAATTVIVCVSDGEREEALAAGLPEEKLVVIPNGLDLARWPLPTRAEWQAARAALRLEADDLVVGFLARLVPQKGADVLVPACEEVLTEFPQAQVCIWGDGPQRSELIHTARALGLRRVRFLGETPDPRSAFLAMDVFVAPSRWEAGPYAVLEAMACALPVVATDVPGHTDAVIHDGTGILIPPDLPGPLSGGIHSLLHDEDERLTYGHNGRARLERHFTLDAMLRSTEALYRKVATVGRVQTAAG
jgi:glycosyltransferase involved in cell wall biosynthesis